MTNVTDGIQTYDDYYFEKGQLFDSYGRKVKIFRKEHTNIDYVTLYKDGKQTTKSLQKLKRWSCPSPRLQRFLKRVQRDFVPVFGFEDTYKFNPKKPFEVFNIKKRTMMKVFKFKKYFAVAIKFKNDQNTLIHQMVMEYYLQKRIDPKKYEIHHLSHRTEQNNISNLLLLPKRIHSKFESYYKCYVGSQYFQIKHTKQDMINLINGFDISQIAKQRLIDSL